MHIVGCQFNKQSGPDAISQHKIEFTVDESQKEGLYNFCKSVSKGTELLLIILDTNKEENEIKELIDEKPEQTKVRLFKRMHALINNIAESKERKPEEIKDSLKEFLIKRKYIKESTKELDIKGLAAAIYYLQTEYEYFTDDKDLETE
jgi:CO dehydrogenase nickel-insertion accessory protein CooC1